jgi:hypothetical protein
VEVVEDISESFWVGRPEGEGTQLAQRKTEKVKTKTTRNYSDKDVRMDSESDKWNRLKRRQFVSPLNGGSKSSMKSSYPPLTCAVGCKVNVDLASLPRNLSFQAVIENLHCYQ